MTHSFLKSSEDGFLRNSDRMCWAGHFRPHRRHRDLCPAQLEGVVLLRAEHHHCIDSAGGSVDGVCGDEYRSAPV
ncbi:hypothetical protein SRHO_G00194570 [Serrasalmus rhombeus]